MKKLGIVALLICVLSIPVFAQSNSLSGWLECQSLERIEKAEYCQYDGAWGDPSFSCPLGMHPLCYHCVCHFKNGVTIDTRACECRY